MALVSKTFVSRVSKLNEFKGAYGIVTVKNMLEVGFDVVGFERHDYIGGLWKATDDPSQTSVLPSKFMTNMKSIHVLIFPGTIANVSKQRVGFISSILNQTPEIIKTEGCK